jgi:diguanylate cyclase (GGDEF)-like protein
MDKILLVEDSRLFSDLITSRIEDALEIPVISTPDLSGAKRIIDEMRDDLFLSILDLTLPDARDAEVVEFANAEQIPSIVFTGSFDDKTRAKILDLDVIDYVTKDAPGSVDYLVSIVQRIYRNRRLTALVVDDSRTARKLISKYLQQYQLKVLEAESGAAALEILNENDTPDGNDLRLVITDFHMPEMDGGELIRSIRKRWPKNELSIIGLSGNDDSHLSARFIKMGANDFLTKPFLPEEFFCRITQDLDMNDQIKALRHAATRDYLTGMYNRRFFFDVATPIFENAKRREADLMVAMIDIDHFKLVNDTYGHDVGDEVLKAVALTLNETTRDTDIIARFGGEEFCLIAPEMAPKSMAGHLEKFRNEISKLSFVEGALSITASIGATNNHTDNLDLMIAQADQRLYEAKETGRNKVVIG